jgi:hypothetical protein
MKAMAGSLHSDPAARVPFFKFRVATALFGVVAAVSVFQLVFLRIDICGDVSGWWVATVSISPLVFVGLCAVCATVTRSDAEKGSRVTVASLLMLLYIYGASATLVGGGALATNWC